MKLCNRLLTAGVVLMMTMALAACGSSKVSENAGKRPGANSAGGAASFQKETDAKKKGSRQEKDSKHTGDVDPAFSMVVNGKEYDLSKMTVADLKEIYEEVYEEALPGYSRSEAVQPFQGQKSDAGDYSYFNIAEEEIPMADARLLEASFNSIEMDDFQLFGLELSGNVDLAATDDLLQTLCDAGWTITGDSTQVYKREEHKPNRLIEGISTYQYVPFTSEGYETWTRYWEDTGVTDIEGWMSHRKNGTLERFIFASRQSDDFGLCGLSIRYIGNTSPFYTVHFQFSDVEEYAETDFWPKHDLEASVCTSDQNAFGTYRTVEQLAELKQSLINFEIPLKGDRGSNPDVKVQIFTGTRYGDYSQYLDREESLLRGLNFGMDFSGENLEDIVQKLQGYDPESCGYLMNPGYKSGSSFKDYSLFGFIGRNWSDLGHMFIGVAAGFVGDGTPKYDLPAPFSHGNARHSYDYLCMALGTEPIRLDKGLYAWEIPGTYFDFIGVFGCYFDGNTSQNTTGGAIIFNYERYRQDVPESEQVSTSYEYYDEHGE